ncbi:MAG: hypothetical protein JXC32_03615, partial [Anaerolineae bacterium]|nr:hypothetical protein [Anaerolineae bacterium]
MSSYRVTVDGREYVVEIPDLSRRPILATVDGETFQVEVKAQEPAPVVVGPVTTAAVAPRQSVPSHELPRVDARPARPAASPSTPGGAISAPLPGTIVAVSV